MTLTLPALLQSREIILHLVGSDKRAVYERALAKGPVAEMPIRAVLGQTAAPVTVFWAP
jgi:6-phosphogluconolactonase